MSVKLDVDGLLYHNIPLKDVTKVEILNRMYSDKRKNKKMLQYHKEIDKGKKYTNNDVHANIYPNFRICQKFRY